MARWGFSGDEVWGVLSIGALCAGDIEEAAKILSRARLGYAVGFLLRLALVAPGLAMRTGGGGGGGGGGGWIFTCRRK